MPSEHWPSTETRSWLYLRARWYDASTGRFNRLDPFFGNLTDPQSLHKYAYVHGDPVNGIDPTGLFTIGDIGVSIKIALGQLAAFGRAAGTALRVAAPDISRQLTYNLLKRLLVDRLIDNHIQATTRELAGLVNDMKLFDVHPELAKTIVAIDQIVQFIRTIRTVVSLKPINSILLPILQNFPDPGKNIVGARNFLEGRKFGIKVSSTVAYSLVALASMPLLIVGVNAVSSQAGVPLEVRLNGVSSIPAMLTKLAAGSIVGSGVGFGNFQSVWLPDVVSKARVVVKANPNNPNLGQAAIETMVRELVFLMGDSLELVEQNGN